jgi:hypothetical protein
MQPGQYEEAADATELPATSDPARADRNMAERDRMFTTCLEEETERLQLRTIQVDTTMTEDDLAEQVTTAFRL